MTNIYQQIGLVEVAIIEHSEQLKLLKQQKQHLLNTLKDILEEQHANQSIHTEAGREGSDGEQMETDRVLDDPSRYIPS